MLRITGALPPRDEHLARLERWISWSIAERPDPDQRQLLHRRATSPSWHEGTSSQAWTSPPPATRRGHASLGDDGSSTWLLPGGRPGQPVSAFQLTERLRQTGIRSRQDRSTAWEGPAMSAPVPGIAPGKYARIERERRFLLDGLPAGEQPAAARKIIDHYLAGTTLRLRCVRQPGGDQYKLTQKIPAPQPGPFQGLITNIYLSEAEHSQLAAALPGRRLAKTRYSIPPLGIDVFDPPLHGLVTAEAEFGTDAEMLAFQPPGYVYAEITGDPRFTGGRLAAAPREDLISWLAQYGISPDNPDLNQRG